MRSATVVVRAVAGTIFDAALWRDLRRHVALIVDTRYRLARLRVAAK